MSAENVEEYRASVWPAEKPNVVQDKHNWFSNGAKLSMNSLFSDRVRNYCELGVWTGHSLRHACTKMPNATIFGVDHWSDNVEDYEKYCPGGLRRFKIMERIPTIYDRFLFNLWDFQKNVVPLKMLTEQGLRKLHEMRVPLDLIYIDACHQYEHVNTDIQLSLQYFPDAVIFGDDFGYGQVRRAVMENAEKRNIQTYCNSRRTWLYDHNLRKLGLDKVPEIFKLVEK